MYGHPHSHAPRSARQPTTRIILAPVASTFAKYQADDRRHPSAGCSRTSERQRATATFQLQASVPRMQSLAMRIANAVREPRATAAAVQSSRSVTPAADVDKYLVPEEFRTSAATVALAGVSSLLLLLLLVYTATRRWGPPREATLVKARVPAARRNRRRRRELAAYYRSATSPGRRENDFEPGEEEAMPPPVEPAVAREDATVRGKKFESARAEAKLSPAAVAGDDADRSAMVARPLPETSAVTAPTSELRNVSDDCVEETEGKAEGQTGDSNDGNISTRKDDNPHISESRSIRVADSNSSGMADRAINELVIERSKVEDKRDSANATSARPGDIQLPAVEVSGRARLSLLPSGGLHTDYEWKRTGVLDKKLLDICNETHGKGSTCASQLLLPCDHPTRLLVAGETATRNFCPGKLRQAPSAPCRPSLQQRKRTREQHRDLIRRRARAAAKAEEAETDTTAQEELTRTESETAELGREPLRWRRREVGKPRMRRRGGSCKYRSRTRPHRTRRRPRTNAASVRMKQRSRDVEGEEERGFVEGVLDRLLIMGALPRLFR